MQAQGEDVAKNDERLPLAPTDNKLKRKRDETDKPPMDSKLQEYLKVMEAPSKSKTWANEDNLQTGTTSLAQNEAALLREDGGPSDAEYEDRSKQPKKRKADSEPRAIANPTQAQRSDQHALDGPAASEIEDATTNDEAPFDAAGAGEKESLAATDADWLRTRTSRLLGLTDADDDPIPITTEPDTLPNPNERLEPSQPEDSRGPDATFEEHSGLIETSAPRGTVDANVAAIELSGRLFVRNLPYSTSANELRQFFSSTGQLEEVRPPLVSAISIPYFF